LAEPARRLAVSDDGTVAWLASVGDSLQRIDLAQWRTGAVVSLVNGPSVARPRALAVMNGTTDRLLVLVRTSDDGDTGILRDLEAVAVLDGSRRSNSVFVAEGASAGHVLAGRTSEEAIVDWGGRLISLSVGEEGVHAKATTQVGFPESTQPNLARIGELLYRGGGEVFQMDSLARVNERAAGRLVAAAEGDFLLAYLSRAGDFQLSERETLVPRGNHAIPWSAADGDPPTLLRWSDRGFATLTGIGGHLRLWESPLVARATADLEVSGSGPDRHEVAFTDGFPTSSAFTWTWTVKNRGPGTAHKVVLALDTGVRHELGTLAPGESRTLSEIRGPSLPAIVRGTATLTSATVDPRPDNDVARLRTDVLAAAPIGIRQQLFDAKHLVASADGRKLWLAAATPAFEGGPALLEIDPASGRVERRLSLAAPPERLAASSDGRYLYVRLGSSRLQRWDLESSTADWTLDFTDERVTDAMPLPVSSRTLVVSTTRRILVLDDAVERPRTLAFPADQRFLGFAGDRLWSAEPGQLRRLRIESDGPVADGEPAPLFLFGGVYDFATDARHLYFAGRVVSVQDGNTFSASTDWPIVTEPSKGVYYGASGQLVRRYDASTLAVIGEEFFPGRGSGTVAMARWGADGLARLTDSGLLWIDRPSIVPESSGGDLEVTIQSPPVLVAYEQAEWAIVVTNRSPEPVTRARLSVTRSGSFRTAAILDFPSSDYFGVLPIDLGDFAGASSKIVRLRATPLLGAYGLQAVVSSGSPADLQGNNGAVVAGNLDFPPGDLTATLLAAPKQVAVGGEFSVRLRIANAGPTAVADVGLRLFRPLGLEYVSVTPGSITTQCCGEEIGAVIGSLAAGESVDVEVRLRRSDPGLTVVRMAAVAGIQESSTADNIIGALVQAVPAQARPVGLRRFEYPRGHTVWSPSRQELVAVFENFPAVVTLGPQSLDPRSEFPLPGLPTQVAVARDGLSAWVGLAGGELVRIDLANGSVLAKFRSDINTVLPFGAFDTVPGWPDVVVAAGISASGPPRVVAYRDGVLLPKTVGNLRADANGFFLAPGQADRLYLSTGQDLRELAVDDSGITEARNLDGMATPGVPISAVPERILFANGRVVDVRTSTFTEPWSPSGTMVADPTTSTIYRCLTDASEFGGGPLTVFAHESATSRVLWQVEVPREATIFGSFGRVVPMGPHGLLLVAFKALRVDGDIAGVAMTDLSLGFQVQDPVIAPGALFGGTATVTHRGPWAARDARLEIEIGGVLELTEPAVSLTDGKGVLPLGDLWSGTNLSFRLRATGIGEGTLRLRARSAIPDVDTSDNDVAWTVRVHGPPTLVLDDSELPEGTDPFAQRPITALLTSPATEDMTVPFRVSLLSAQDTDLVAREGTFLFTRGSRVSTVPLVISDDLPERNERFVVEVPPGAVALSRTSAVITIVDDDLPFLTVGTESLIEGNAGVNPGPITVTLSPSVAEPVEVRYHTRDGTATAGVDYVAQSGWLRFDADRNVRSIRIPILGDALYEPSETFDLVIDETPGVRAHRFAATSSIRNDDRPPAPIASLERQPDLGWRVHFDTVPGARYRLQTRPALGTGAWGNVGSSVTGIGQPTSLPVPTTPAGTLFLRVRVD
ncbi:MAG: hypothetical protein JNL97_02815, partial [Verrucomicrobiales bacterium]|nr:hypothetical protein [Verrucomicrobiales bacterium]